ncbi:MAG TPA: hypothetical protein VFA21_19700 [Pyrinomonadaceae bacterium]|nr:hypothetical protein [Pyrinomonadaceae bacterium]
MLDVKQATQSATDQLVDLYPQMARDGIQLEEVELSDDEKYWFITLSYPLPGQIPVLNLPPKKEYKVFKIDSQTGKARSMRIRKLD